MNEGTRSGKSTIRLLGISAERPTNGLYLYFTFKDRRGYSHLEEEALDRTMWRNHFGGGFEPVVRENTE
jgi:hypothetical protein